MRSILQIECMGVFFSSKFSFSIITRLVSPKEIVEAVEYYTLSYSDPAVSSQVVEASLSELHQLGLTFGWEMARGQESRDAHVQMIKNLGGTSPNVHLLGKQNGGGKCQDANGGMQMYLNHNYGPGNVSVSNQVFDNQFIMSFNKLFPKTGATEKQR